MKRLLIIAHAAVAAVSSAHAQPPAPPVDTVPFDSGPIPFLRGARITADLTPGYILIEGDIQVRIADWIACVFADGTYGPATLWTSGIVPFDFDLVSNGGVSATNQQLAINAMNAISQRSGVVFRAATAQDPDRIRFRSSTSNNSAVGRQGGTQIINIISWGTQIVICHELYHSLGFQHEQTRPDRATFVTINTAAICGSSTTPGDPCNASVCQSCFDSNGQSISCAHNFNLISNASTYGPYDFDSFMHYGRTAFSCSGANTIIVNPPWATQWQNAIGQRSHFSVLDELTCRGLYPMPDDRWLRQGGSGSNQGTFNDPFHTTFSAAYGFTPAGGTLLIDPGSYSGVGTFSTPMTIRATYDIATIGN